MAVMELATVPRRGLRIRERLSDREIARLAGMYGFVALLHVVGFGLLLAATRGHYRLSGSTTFGLGTGLLAYSLGMRHAFDADHISAIDNTTRKLMSEGKRPLGVGFFFSLGHSSVVFVMTILLGLGVKTLGSQVRDDNSALHHYTGVIGTSVSGTFLLLIALFNIIVLVPIVKVFIEMRKGTFDEPALEEHLNSRGFMYRFFGPLIRSVDTSWKLFPIGFLFGLGFDTFTEVAFLVLAGSSVAAGLPLWALLSLPILFAAGMSLLDTTDGTFMNFAYGWAFSNPVRKVYYNMTITGLSVIVALFIGGLEVAQVSARQLNLTGGFWGYAGRFDINKAGFMIVGLFVAVWLLALAIWRFGRVESRWGVPATAPAAPGHAATPAHLLRDHEGIPSL
jgi:high-affinity nickel-transport protein